MDGISAPGSPARGQLIMPLLAPDLQDQEAQGHSPQGSVPFPGTHFGQLQGGSAMGLIHPDRRGSST